MEVKDQAKALMKQVRKDRVPTSEAIVQETIRELGYTADSISSEEAERRFNELLRNLWIKTLEVLERHEASAYPEGIPSALIQLRRDDVVEMEALVQTSGFREAIKELFVRWYPWLREAFLSIRQSRMQRGGKDFELQLGHMLDLIRVPYQKVKRAYRVDFMIPSDEFFKTNPSAAAILSAKRTLRERWRQVVEELFNMRAPNIFLATADEKISKDKAEEICGKWLIHLVVWDHVKADAFANEPRVLGYTEWASSRVRILRQFWPA